MFEVGVKELDTYINLHQNTVAQFIAIRPIMDLCLAAVWCPGAWVLKRWWEQEGLDIKGIQEAAQAEEGDIELDYQAGEEAEFET